MYRPYRREHALRSAPPVALSAPLGMRRAAAAVTAAAAATLCAPAAAQDCTDFGELQTNYMSPVREPFRSLPSNRGIWFWRESLTSRACR